MSDTPAKPDPYAPWRNRDYRRYAGSWFAMTFSKRIESLAAQVYFVSIFDTSDAFLALGGMGLVQALPVMLLAIAGGQLADRFDRRRVMIITHCLTLIASAGLLAVALLDAPVLWIFVFLGLGSVGQALNGPSRSAMLPQLVPAENFATAVAWNSSVFYLGSVTGPMVGGVILALSASSAPAFAVVMACRFLAIGAIVLIRYRQSSREMEAVSWESVVAGIRFVRNSKLILATITLDLFAVLFGGAVYLLPIFAEKILHVGPVGLGFLQAADAIGAVTMAMLLAHMPPMRRAGVTLLWAVAGFGVATIVFGLSQWFWLSLAAMFLVGALDNISVVVRHTLVQMLTPDEMRGRVSAVNNVFIVASNDIGGFESSLAAWFFGPVISVVGGGAVTIVVVFLTMLIFPEILSLGSLGAIKPEATEEPSHI